ncbi:MULTISPECIES: hypothetical protein [Brevundimonas]|uniref:hypothetical protein n=1 Tax=Brevundimonas TaxID=41275 RepID=UPI000F022657|nr:hypothetical protein [Brevundimonas lutea]
MKRILIAVAAVSSLAAPAFAQSSDSINLSGEVAQICTIATSGDQTINLISGSQDVGDVTIHCNDPGGFTVTATSAKNSALVHTEAPGSSYAYTMNSTPWGAVRFGVPVNANDIGGAGLYVTPQVVGLDISVGSITGPAFAGDYTDQVTFTISAN